MPTSNFWRNSYSLETAVTSNATSLGSKEDVFRWTFACWKMAPQKAGAVKFSRAAVVAAFPSIAPSMSRGCGNCSSAEVR